MKKAKYIGTPEGIPPELKGSTFVRSAAGVRAEDTSVKAAPREGEQGRSGADAGETGGEEVGSGRRNRGRRGDSSRRASENLRRAEDAQRKGGRTDRSGEAITGNGTVDDGGALRPQGWGREDIER